eukprot:CAMPEP_0177727880 /NCGR_PEP_ID=MMETSP0484_2-20121128/20565_1 /TAXON_ID=354590 /ORGANISM="Rhodomonas lens, Strain RHODO" /LENGTH=353 /DNA_ID=CAMNT_0019240579 /DNA_START=60 /DNA_END=1121 /DNA_ORIENTATION=+
MSRERMLLGWMMSGRNVLATNLAQRRAAACHGEIARRAALSESVSRSLSSGPRSAVPSQSWKVYKAKQSLSQNFIVDKRIARRIAELLHDTSEGGKAIGPGKGAITAPLLDLYPKMRAVEIDRRSVYYLGTALPGVRVVHGDVLQYDWKALAAETGERISVIGNLPFSVTSQILFSLFDSAPVIRSALVTLQLEVAQRVCAPPGKKPYGLLSVVTRLYGDPKFVFTIPASAFRPRPDVTVGVVRVDFPAERPRFDVSECDLRIVIRAAFHQRRKMLRQSLKKLLAEKEVTLPEEFATKRPEQLEPLQFVHLTRIIFGKGSTPPGVAVWRGKLQDEARYMASEDAAEGEGDEEE